MSNKDNGFPSKYEKKLPTGFKDDADAFDTEKLKSTILECESNIVTVDRDMQENEELQALKNTLKDLSAGYREAKQAQTAKIKYCLHLLESRGVSL